MALRVPSGATCRMAVTLVERALRRARIADWRHSARVLVETAVGWHPNRQAPLDRRGAIDDVMKWTIRDDDVARLHDSAGDDLATASGGLKQGKTSCFR